MNGLLKVTRFQFRDQRNAIAIFYSIIVALAALGTFAVLRDTKGNSSMGGLGMTSVVFIFILGLNCFTSTFKFMQANNVSRRRFYIGNVLALSIIALFMATIDTSLGFVIRLVIPYTSMTEQLYGMSSLLPELIWTSTLATLAAHVGWLISMVYYRSNKLQKTLVSVSPLFGIITLVYLNRRTAGAFGRAIISFMGWALGFKAQQPSPYVASLSFIIATMVVASLCFLLIRRAPVKD